MARNGVDGRSRTSAAGQGGDLLQPRHVGGVRGQRPAEQQRAGVDQRPAAEPVLGTQLCVVPPPDGVEVAQRELVQGGVPGEVAQAVDRRAVAGDPAVHPGQTRSVVAGLVVGVRPRVGGVAGAGLDGQRPAAQLHRLVEAALLLADEGEQPGEPPVVAVRRDRPLDDRPGLLRHLGDPGERDRRHRGREQQRVQGVRREVGDQRSRVAGDVAARRRARGCARARCRAPRAGTRRGAEPRCPPRRRARGRAAPGTRGRARRSGRGRSRRRARGARPTCRRSTSRSPREYAAAASGLVVSAYP